MERSGSLAFLVIIFGLIEPGEAARSGLSPGVNKQLTKYCGGAAIHAPQGHARPEGVERVERGRSVATVRQRNGSITAIAACGCPLQCHV